MSSDVKVHGELLFAEPEALSALLVFDAADQSQAEIGTLVADGVQRKDNRLIFSIDGHLSNIGNLDFQEWLSDLADAAIEGSLDTWQEAFGAARFVRIYAGGDEEVFDEPYPEHE